MNDIACHFCQQSIVYEGINKYNLLTCNNHIVPLHHHIFAGSLIMLSLNFKGLIVYYDFDWGDYTRHTPVSMSPQLDKLTFYLEGSSEPICFLPNPEPFTYESFLEAFNKILNLKAFT